VETDLWEYYEAKAPGHVILLGPDVYNGTPAQLASFQSNTGAAYPLLLYGGNAQGGNLWDEYADRDNYVVLDQDNVVRFNARLQGYSWGSSLDLSRIRGVVDSLLVNPPASVDGVPAGGRVEVAPSPFVADVHITFALPAGPHVPVRLSVFDPAGRRLSTLFDGVPAADRVDVTWDGRDTDGAPAAAGVYLLRAASGRTQWTRRIVKLR
jgi:hypothetical protein